MLGEDAELAGLGRARLDGEPVHLDVPASLRRGKTLAAPAADAVEAQVGLAPASRLASMVFCARMGSIDEVVAESLQTPTIARIDQLIAVHERIFTETGREATSNVRQSG